MFGGAEIPIIVGAAILLFGGGKIRDVARGLGAAKKEFSIGQAEADIAAERMRAEARAAAEAAYATSTVVTPEHLGVRADAPISPTHTPVGVPSTVNPVDRTGPHV